MTFKYRERDTLKGDHSRATNPSGRRKHKTQKPTSHTCLILKQFAQKRDSLSIVLQPYSLSPHGPSRTSP